VIAPISNDGKLRHFSFEERAMESESNSGSSRHALSAHILSASVVMIGVSTTLIGLVKVAKAHNGRNRGRSICGSYRSALSLQRAHFLLTSDRPSQGQRRERRREDHPDSREKCDLAIGRKAIPGTETVTNS
jgi:hypothetical protein